MALGIVHPAGDREADGQLEHGTDRGPAPRDPIVQRIRVPDADRRLDTRGFSSARSDDLSAQAGVAACTPASQPATGFLSAFATSGASAPPRSTSASLP